MPMILSCHDSVFSAATLLRREITCLCGPATPRKQGRPGLQTSNPTGRSSGPVSVSVQLHQQWLERAGCASVWPGEASAGTPTYMFLVRNFLQTRLVFMVTL